MSFQCPSQKTNGSPTTSNLHTAPPPQQPYAGGQWNSGKPQIWCPYHEACRPRSNRTPGANGTLASRRYGAPTMKRGVPITLTNAANAAADPPSMGMPHRCRHYPPTPRHLRDGTWTFVNSSRNASLTLHIASASSIARTVSSSPFRETPLPPTWIGFGRIFLGSHGFTWKEKYSCSASKTPIRNAPRMIG